MHFICHGIYRLYSPRLRGGSNFQTYYPSPTLLSSAFSSGVLTADVSVFERVSVQTVNSEQEHGDADMPLVVEKSLCHVHLYANTDLPSRPTS
jgi:hypothetical protein